MKIEEKIKKIIENSPNKLQALLKLGWNTQTNGYRKLNKFIERHNLNISHFETIKERINRINKNEFIVRMRNKIDLSEILIEKSTYQNMTTLKNRLYNTGIKKRECEECGQNEFWHGKKLSLILDHINGIHDDNRIENLRILCPNCNATLDTHCGKNKKYKINKNKGLGYTTVSYIKNQYTKRKVNRPEYDHLLNDIKNLGYVGTGKKYDVSDNTIRKWIKAYIKYKI